MKAIDVQEHYSAASGIVEVTFPATATEAAELRKALALVRKYERAALKALKDESGIDPTQSEFHYFKFAVRSKSVVVSIHDGMTG
jgi:hypothetical protein